MKKVKQFPRPFTMANYGYPNQPEQLQGMPISQDAWGMQGQQSFNQPQAPNYLNTFNPGPGGGSSTYADRPITDNTQQDPNQPQPIQQPQSQKQSKSKLAGKISLPGTGTLGVLGLGLLNSMIPQHETMDYNKPQLAYNPYAQGTGSQAIMEFGGTSPYNHYGRGMQPLIRTDQPYKPHFPDANMKNGGWIQKAVNPSHKGYCTPMTKSTCTPHRKAFAQTMKKNHGFHKAEDGHKSKIKVFEDYSPIGGLNTDNSYGEYGPDSYQPQEMDTTQYDQTSYNTEQAPNNMQYMPSSINMASPQPTQIPEISTQNRMVTYEKLHDASGNLQYSPVFNGNWEQHDILNTLKQLPKEFNGVPTISDPTTYMEHWKGFSNQISNQAPQARYAQPIHTTGQQQTRGEYDVYNDNQYMRYGGSVYNVPQSYVPLQGKYGMKSCCYGMKSKKYEFGGKIQPLYEVGKEYELSDEEIDNLKSQGYVIE